ncbi:MAG: metallophosphoesterase [Treponema sp.]|nr:metallophosphoesterase [Treponema sp.]
MKSSAVSVASAIALATLTMLLPSSCKPIELGLYKVFEHGPAVSERADRLEEVKGPDPVFYGKRFAFLVTSDVHFGNKGASYTPREDDSFFDELRVQMRDRAVPPSFGICLGDVVENGNVRDEFRDYVDWCDKIEEILGTGNRVYTTTGNHDLYNEGWEYFEEYVYPHTGFFHFNAGGFSFYFLDSGSGSLGKKQYELFEEAVKKDELPKIVSTHVPVYGTSAFIQNYYSMQNTEESSQLITLCADNNVKLYLAGHMHTKHENDLGKFDEIVMPCYAVYHEFAIVTVDTDSHSVTWEFYEF